MPAGRGILPVKGPAPFSRAALPFPDRFTGIRYLPYAMIGNIFCRCPGTNLKIIRFEYPYIVAVHARAVAGRPAICIPYHNFSKNISWIMPVLQEQGVACEHSASGCLRGDGFPHAIDISCTAKRDPALRQGTFPFEPARPGILLKDTVLDLQSLYRIFQWKERGIKVLSICRIAGINQNII
jgi:hypothetical protein